MIWPPFITEGKVFGYIPTWSTFGEEKMKRWEVTQGKPWNIIKGLEKKGGQLPDRKGKVPLVFSAGPSQKAAMNSSCFE